MVLAMRAVIVGGLFVLMALAGCIEGEDVDPASSDENVEADAATVDPKLRIEAKNCHQGGGNSVYSMEPGQTKIGPWYAQDQNPEVGDPVIGAYGMPVTGPSNGIWHVATICESYTYMGEEYQDFGMGWIAQMIERPDYDEWGEPRIQFFVADLSFNNQDFVDAMYDATGGAEISKALETTIEMYPAEKYMHVVISEARHGTFDFTAELHKEFAQKQTEHIRFWMLVSSEGAHDHDEASDDPVYTPISVDIYDTVEGDGTWKLAGESVGTFTHFPDGHVGNPLGHYWDGFDRVIEIGPAPEGITHDVTWLH